MINISRVLLIIFTVVLGLFATGCPQRRSLADVESNPGRYNGKEVVIVGVVTDSYGLSIPGTGVRGGAYKVDDGTGSIWVVTDRTVPGKGARLAVQGTVSTGVSWKGKAFGLGMTEAKRKFEKR